PGVGSLRALLRSELLVHGGVRQPLAAERHAVALPRRKAPAAEEIERAVTDVGSKPRSATAAGEPFQCVDKHGADPLPGHGRMNVKHVEPLAAGKRGKADGRAVDGTQQSYRLGEPRGEGCLVVGRRRPGLLLRRAVIVAGELRDAGAEDFRQQRRVRRQERPQRKLWLCARHHRFTFQVVAPSLWSSSSMSIALSSSRMRSASLKFFALLAALRPSISALILLSSTPPR